MRFIVIIFLVLALGFSCVKKQTKNPVPSIEYVSFSSSKTNGKDDGQLVLGYEDGDGDIFRDESTKIPNIIMKFYYFNSGTKKFTGTFDPITQDTTTIAINLKQPPNTDYKGKSIKGEIFIPMGEFRASDTMKIFKFVVFVMDEAGHKSNVVTTPQFTVNY
jgi:hypothetical protein